MSPQLQHLFAQLTPWGWTIGQTVLVIAIAFVALTVFGFLRGILRLGTSILGIGCLLVVLFLCGVIVSRVFNVRP